jgi:transposase-like protein
MARTSSITPAQAKKLEAAFRETSNVAEVARLTGINADRIRRWKKARDRPSPEQLHQEGLDKIKEGLRLIERSQKAKAGDP